jgi:hypothetical protein
MVRLGVLFLFLVLAATLHHRGSTYNTIHIVYFVVIAGVLVASFAARGRGRGRGGGRFGPPGGGVGRGSFGSGPPRRDGPPENSNPDAGD